MEIQPERFSIIHTAPALMTCSERVVLYSLVFGLRPQRCLEIGTKMGGSALVIGAALDDIGAGQLVCLDSEPQVKPEHWQQLAHRAKLITGMSPQDLPRTVEAAGGLFDFALIDADHELPGVIKDIEGVLPLLSSSAYILLHDAHYYGVADAIDRMLKKYSDRLTDCGMLSAEQTPEGRTVKGRPVIWGGLRLLRYHVSAPRPPSFASRLAAGILQRNRKEG